MSLTFGSLFAGIGGFDLGLERSGMTPLWQVEIDDYATKVLEKHWPDVKRYRDVREVHGAMAHASRGRHRSSEEKVRAGGNAAVVGGDSRTSCPTCLPPVDVICGGFPCQPHSLAGKRKGKADDRDLWPEYRRLIDELRPRWIVAENVPGIRTTILDQMLSDLEGLGYATETVIIPACAVDAPHRRDRVWIVAYSGSTGRRQNTPGAHGNETENEGRATENHYQPTSNGQGGKSRTVAHAEGQPIRAGVRQSEPGRQRGRRFSNGSGAGIRWSTEPGMGGLDDGLSPGLAGPRWLPEPGIGRVATGIPDRVNKLKALGNAIVPAVAQFIGEIIIECHLASIQEQD